MTNEKCDHCGAKWGLGDNQWIDVSGRTPVDYERVLIAGDDGVFSGYISYNSWQCDPIGSYAGDGCVFGITHWMPLPKTPGE